MTVLSTKCIHTCVLFFSLGMQAQGPCRGNDCVKRKSWGKVTTKIIT